MVKVELLGGPLDGAILSKSATPDRITLKNPNPLTFQSKLCAPLILNRVAYVYSHCLVIDGNDSKVFYVFEGHLE